MDANSVNGFLSLEISNTTVKITVTCLFDKFMCLALVVHLFKRMCVSDWVYYYR